MEYKLQKDNIFNYIFMSSSYRDINSYPQVNKYCFEFRRITNLIKIKLDKVYLPKTIGLLDYGVIFLNLDSGTNASRFISKNNYKTLTFPLYLENLSTSEFYIGKSDTPIYLESAQDMQKFSIEFVDINGNLIDFGELPGDITNLSQNYISLELESIPQDF